MLSINGRSFIGVSFENSSNSSTFCIVSYAQNPEGSVLEITALNTTALAGNYRLRKMLDKLIIPLSFQSPFGGRKVLSALKLSFETIRESYAYKSSSICIIKGQY